MNLVTRLNLSDPLVIFDIHEKWHAQLFWACPLFMYYFDNRRICNQLLDVVKLEVFRLEYLIHQSLCPILCLVFGEDSLAGRRRCQILNQ